VNTPILVRIDPRWPGAWDSIKDYLLEAWQKGSHEVWTMEDVYGIAMQGGVVCWGVIQDNKVIGAALTGERIYPRKKILEILLFAMDHNTEDEWLSLWEGFAAMARKAGFNGISGGGRPGWAKKLQHIGAKLKYNIEIDL